MSIDAPMSPVRVFIHVKAAACGTEAMRSICADRVLVRIANASKARPLPVNIIRAPMPPAASAYNSGADVY
ncbi:hypothetical protein [Streptomyces sp. NPDC048111]|uniref:hypothetical protein n=1 Tax=Streptomyces sp. NPDC048111 TaxID=3365500 RepID=UPI00371E4D55